LLGENDVIDVFERHESLKKARERMQGKLASLESEIEKHKAEAPADESGAADPPNSPDDDTAADKQ